MFMYLDNGNMRTGILRLKPCVLVITFVVLYLCIQLIKVFFYVQQNDISHSVVSSISDVDFKYSNELVFQAVQETRKEKCRRYAERDSLKHICAFELRKDVVNISESDYTNRLPGCLIIGTYKSGTRALIDFLAMHPQIVIRREPVYEIAYFDKNVDKGLGWYREEMPKSLQGQITIEKSPSYFYSEQTPRRIHEMNSSMKLILIVRRPLERAISEFTFDFSVAKKQYGGNFYNCAIDPWTKEVNGNCHVLRHSVYDLPIIRYLQYFNTSQMLIINADDFRRDPFSVIERVEEHLGVTHVIHQDDFIYNTHRNIYCTKAKNATESGICYDNTRGRLKYDINITDKLRDKLNTWFKGHSDRFFNLIRMSFPWS